MIQAPFIFLGGPSMSECDSRGFSELKDGKWVPPMPDQSTVIDMELRGGVWVAKPFRPKLPE